MGIRVMIVLFCLLFASRSQAAPWALDFDSVDDCVTVPWNSSLPVAVFTVSAWIKARPQPRRGAIVARGEDDDSWNLSWQMEVLPGGQLEVMLEDANDNNTCYPFHCMSGAPTPNCSAGDLFVADDAWHHVVLSRDASGELVIHVDGDERMTCTGSALPSSNNFQDLTFGCTHGTIGPPPGGEEPPIWFFRGAIDEVAIWNRALSSGEVGDVFASGVSPGDAGLVGYWAFDEGAGQVVGDLAVPPNAGFLGFEPTEDSSDPDWIESTVSTHAALGGAPPAPRASIAPNPFGESTVVRYELEASAIIRVRILDVSGRLVRTLEDRAFRGPGVHRVTWDGRDGRGSPVPAGYYFSEIRGEGFREVLRVVRLQ